MEKRYQVFVSSTFTDLQQERQGIMQTLMQLDCIPAGMELFPAADEEQWAFIRKVIADCDYYLLLIGGRYGSLTAEGVSYTEKEYDYAVQQGIHVMAFLHGEVQQLPLAKSEVNDLARKRLEEFRVKVSANRLVKFWKSSPELLQQTVLSLTHAFKAHPRDGWIRGTQKLHAEVANELSRLSRENLDLRKLQTERDFSIIDALINTVDCQYLIWMMETGRDLMGWSWHVYELAGGGAGSGQLDRNKFLSRFAGIGMVRGAGGGRFVELTDLGHEFARWLVVKGRKCEFFYTPQGGWGEAAPGSVIEGWIKQQEEQFANLRRPVATQAAKTPPPAGKSATPMSSTLTSHASAVAELDEEAQTLADCDARADANFQLLDALEAEDDARAH